jgi:hypothetical protein
MSKKLGEELIDRGLLDRPRLHDALKAQLIRGGTLGTSLIELGLVDEAALGRTLSEIFGLPHAPAEMFAEIPLAVLEAVPVEIVRKHRVLPIGIEGRSLHLAVVDPRDLSGLSTVTGCRIVPYVAPELRVLIAMERYYGIARRLRYVQVSETAPPGRTRPRGPLVREEQAAPAVDRRRAARSADVLADLSSRLARVESHGELGEIILDFVEESTSRCILFDVSGERAVVANWKGVELAAGTRTLPLDPESLFSVIAENQYYRGSVPPDLDGGSFFGELGMDVPREILVLPIYGDERLEAVVYGDGGGKGRIQEPSAPFDVLLERVGMAMRVLSLKTALCAHSTNK